MNGKEAIFDKSTLSTIGALSNSSLYFGPYSYGGKENQRLGGSNLAGYIEWLKTTYDIDFWSDQYRNLGEELQSELAVTFEVNKERVAAINGYGGWVA